MARISWLALSYNLPINPSTARVYTWRKLRELGAEYLRQGVALLPNTAQSNQQLTLLAQKIRQMGGEASLLEMRFLDPHAEQEMAARFEKQSQDAYEELLEDCAATVLRLKKLGNPPTAKETEAIRRMVKRYCHVRARDYFRAYTGAQEVQDGLDELVESVRSVAADVGKQLRGLLDG